MIHGDFNLVLKYCEVLDEFIKIRVFSDDEARDLIKKASDGDKARFQQEVVRVCIADCNESILPRVQDMEQTGSMIDVEEMLYMLCIDVNPALDIHQVSVQISVSEMDQGDDPRSQARARQRSRKTMRRIANIVDEVSKQVIGQHHAVEVVCQAVKKSVVGLRDLEKPIGAFLFAGQPGVGKTELAKAMTQYLYGSQARLIRVDCSEYALPHEYAKLIGSPPGYIGHNEGGYLTEAAKEMKEFVVLFDEIDKAHSKMHNILLQLLDEGMVTDSKGFKVSFRNALVLMTSNLGVREVEEARSAMGFNHAARATLPYEEMRNEINEALKKAFRPEFLNRLDEVIVFNTLSQNDTVRIVDKMLRELGTITERNGIKIVPTQDLKYFIADEGFRPEWGAREIRRTIKRLIENPLTELILDETVTDGDIIRLAVEDGKVAFEKIDVEHQTLVGLPA
ncbi:MAG: ATP-dependent Clp protease ATP-binding subunit [Planctomycetes bacterium]|nr:ATP-dependent Clp protease ATP-binding subunit [Planctomycetota bacterium]